LQPHDIEFFAEHGEADTEHSNIGYELVEQFATANDLQVRVLKALRKGLSIWWTITDGVAREAAKIYNWRKTVVGLYGFWEYQFQTRYSITPSIQQEILWNFSPPST
jgi:hypothetical protein